MSKRDRLTLQPQIIDDQAVSGLTLVVEGTSYDCRIRILGDLPFGNRDFAFDRAGELVGTGTHLLDCPRPTFLRVVEG
jgi:hypothetical protein